jgi:hypothetical protein
LKGEQSIDFEFAQIFVLVPIRRRCELANVYIDMPWVLE